MKTLRLSLHVLAVAILVVAFSSIASAQSPRTWVSGVGDDANPCSRTAPCKTFAGAISKTATNGEINCLDPGGFGQVTINKSITIDCNAGPGSILASAGSGVVINAANSVVTLRNFNINGDLLATNGINILAAKAVHLVNLNLYEFTGAGVNVATSATVFMSMQNVNISESVTGVNTTTTAGSVAVDMDHVSVWNTTTGINAQNGSRIQVHNCTLFNNTTGVNQSGLAAGGSTVTVFQSFLTNVTDLQSVAGASMGASGNVFSGGGIVFNQNGGLITSAGDNVLNGNGATGALGAGGIFKI